MIVQEYTEGYGGRLIHTYSDTGHRIVQTETGIVYDTADDITPCPYTYTESDELVRDEEATIDDYKEALKDLGVNVDEESET